jgi:hypothetical protein
VSFLGFSVLCVSRKMEKEKKCLGFLMRNFAR